MVSRVGHETFAEIVRRIRAVATPQKIVLFGSRARATIARTATSTFWSSKILRCRDTAARSRCMPRWLICRSTWIRR